MDAVARSVDMVWVTLSAILVIFMQAGFALLEEPFVDLLLHRFGARRLYWGSDFAPSLDHVSFAQTLHPVGLNGLSAAEAADVFGGNLCRALRR